MDVGCCQNLKQLLCSCTALSLVVFKCFSFQMWLWFIEILEMVCLSKSFIVCYGYSLRGSWLPRAKRASLLIMLGDYSYQRPSRSSVQTLVWDVMFHRIGHLYNMI